MRTNGNTNKQHAVWDHKLVYLPGHLDQSLLEEHLDKHKVQLEIHDRDAMAAGDQGLDKQRITRLEKMLAGGYPFNIVTGEFVSEAELPNVDPADIEVKGPMSIFEVDDKLIEEWETDVTKARTKYNHGTAPVSLAALIDTSKQLSAAFAANNANASSPATSDALSTTNQQVIVKGRFDIVQQRPARKPKGNS